MSFLYLSPAEQYHTTFVRETFPNTHTHLPLENARHKLGHALHDFVRVYDNDIRSPRADVRETLKRYYIDVELPGLASKKDFSLQWTNYRTLLVQAEIKRPEVEEEIQAKEEANISKEPVPAAADGPSGEPASEQKAKESTRANKKVNSEHLVHFLARERTIGTFARAFHFPIDVDHDNIQANLQNGLLSIIVPKPESEHRRPDKHIIDVRGTES